ncbi:HlyD family secretion protein [Brevundimonas aurantiaca]|uniref:HlyD family secretion protein n=1 Tax=Brevundimonas aurantiaca TaxID=74316 RepID=UPI00174A6411|nr:HlyD family efflux transporter periplasmic adaptor subunit [Brevundimonas aurantiaca]
MNRGNGDVNLFRNEVRAAQADRLHGEVILRQHNSHIMLASLLVAIMIAAGAWLSLSHFARIETAPGILTTTQPTAKVYSPRAGIVTNFLVADGDLVRAGQKLVTVNADITDDKGLATAAGSAASVRSQVLLAENQIVLLERSRGLEEKRLRDLIAAGEGQLAALRRQQLVQNDIISSQKRLFDQIEDVAARGFISRTEYERRRQTYLAATQAGLQIEQQIFSLSSQVEQAHAQLRNASVTYSREVGTMQSSIQALEQQRIQFAGAESFVIAAPISGRLTAAQVGAGQVVQTNVPMFSIVPDQAMLRAEVFAPSRAVGLVKVGQEATIAFDAFPYQRFGTAKGRVQAISKVVLSPQEANAPFEIREPVYKVVIALDEQTMLARGAEHALQPGMTLSANIVLERQTFLEWLLSPLTAVSKRA